MIPQSNTFSAQNPSLSISEYFITATAAVSNVSLNLDVKQDRPILLDETRCFADDDRFVEWATVLGLLRNLPGIYNRHVAHDTFSLDNICAKGPQEFTALLKRMFDLLRKETIESRLQREQRCLMPRT